jgi:hypothetical protein
MLDNFSNDVTKIDVYFDPNSSFITMMQFLAEGKTVVDCGCGHGHTNLMLSQAGVQVIGIDIELKKIQLKDVVLMDAVDFPFTSEHIAMICRPSRGEWIKDTITKAVEGGALCVYVGLEKHYDADLSNLTYQVDKLMDNAGVSGESVWAVRKA